MQIKARAFGTFLFNHYKLFIFTTAMPRATKLDKMVTYHDGVSPIKSHDLWSHRLSKSRDKLKTHLHYHSAYGQQIWQDRNLPWWVSANKVTWNLYHLVLEDLVQTKIIISPLPMPLWPINFGRWWLTVRGFYL